MMTGAEILAMLGALEVDEYCGFVGYGEEHAWTQIPGLWRFPYFADLLLTYILDVMHTEEYHRGTLGNNVKTRLDQATLCNRPKLDMIPPGTDKS